MPTLFTRLKRSKTCVLAIKAGLTVLMFWLLFRGIDFAHLEEMLHAQNHNMIAAAVFFIVAQIVLGAVRWRMLLASLAQQGERILSTLAAIRIFTIGVFFGCCLPGAVGSDVVRVWLSKAEHITMPLAIHSVIIDRMVALISLVILVLAVLPLLHMGFPWMTVLSALALAAAFGVWLLFRIDRLLAPVKHWRIVHWILYFAASLRLIIARPLTLTAALILSIISHGGFCIGAWILAQSLGIQMTLLQAVALIPPVVLATTIPISIGGWGVREAGFVGMLGLIGVAPAAALMLSLQLGLLGILTSLPGGLLWLAGRKHTEALA